jgi:2-oxo-hept-3-ene-1,7-dioate hydratase
MSDQLAVEALMARFEKTQELVDEAPAWKVSLNFREWQQKLGLTHALAAPIPRLETYVSGLRISVASDRKIHIEAELALRLGADVRRISDPFVIDSLQPCLELVDYTFPFGDLSTLFSHSFFHAGVVLGLERPLAQLPSFASGLPCVRNGATRHERVPGTVPDNIVQALGALSQRVLEAGASLRRGQLVLCGSYAQPIALGEGERVEADFGEELGRLSIER